MKTFVTVLLIMLIVVSYHSYSQEEIIEAKPNITAGLIADSTKLYRIELNDGTVFIGSVIDVVEDRICISNQTFPRLEILNSGVLNIIELDDKNYSEGKFWFQNPNSTRYVFAPSGYNLKEGEGYYQTIWGLFHFVNVGVSDNFSIGGGVEILSLSAGDPIIFLTPKFGVKAAEKINIGAGVLYLRLPSDLPNLGIMYGVTTFGGLDNNLTLGLGWGFIDGSFSSNPVITISGMRRVGTKVSLTTENWIITGSSEILFSYGIRFFGENLSIDVSFINTPDVFRDNILGFPMLGFVWKF
jgi:hypothetical protein